MFGDGALTFREFAMGEKLPLATIHDAMLKFLRGRDDAVLYGAQAVNAYVNEPRTPAQAVKKVLVVTPAELIANKVVSMVQRTKKRKGFMDRADLIILLLTFPELKEQEGPVADRLRAAGATHQVMAAWKKLAAQEILPDDEDEGY